MSKIFFEKIVRRFVSNLFTRKYHYRNIDAIPNKICYDVIYIVQEGTKPETLVFMCPCGCKQPVYLNLLKDTTLFWTYKIEKKKISVFPSVVRKKGCGSHYYIQRGIVKWLK
jgi:Family of unknown function (DUF6527)